MRATVILLGRVIAGPPEKVQPPVSAGYEGLLFPPEQSVKVTGKSFLKQALISNTNFKILLVGQVCKMQ
jgi:hypothetical protein